MNFATAFGFSLKDQSISTVQYTKQLSSTKLTLLFSEINDMQLNVRATLKLSYTGYITLLSKFRLHMITESDIHRNNTHASTHTNTHLVAAYSCASATFGGPRTSNHSSKMFSPKSPLVKTRMWLGPLAWNSHIWLKFSYTNRTTSVHLLEPQPRDKVSRNAAERHSAWSVPAAKLLDFTPGTYVYLYVYNRWKTIKGNLLLWPTQPSILPG